MELLHIYAYLKKIFRNKKAISYGKLSYYA